MLFERFFGEAEDPASVIQDQWYELGCAQWQGTRSMQNDVILSTGWDEQKGILLALADGLGTDRGAGMAAKTVMEAMRQDYEQEAPCRELHHQLLRMLGSAHAKVRNLNTSRRQNGDPPTGASTASVMIRGYEASFVSVGNVRVFLFRQGRLLQLNRDNLLSLEAEEQEILSGNQPSIDPDWAMTVTAYVGMEGLKLMDYMESPFRLLSGDRLVLMSSGMYGTLTESELCAYLKYASPQEAADQVMSRVQICCRDSQSNASIVILKVNHRRRTQRTSCDVQRY